MGLCQQFDVLYEELTAKEHLELVCAIKDIGEDTQRQITETLELVMLTRHENKRPKEMSGGMKRKLSLAMALIGNSKTIILDEPTSGLDVESRRQVWELILKIRQGRSIIMSTQHIEEADVLSNRICVMDHGKLIALDTPSNIKRRFGVGYNLYLEPINLNQMKPVEIKELADRVREVALSPDRGFYGLYESKDSVNKKLVFLVPFSEVDKISGLI